MHSMQRHQTVPNDKILEKQMVLPWANMHKLKITTI